MAGPDRLSDLGDSILGRAQPFLPDGPVVVALSGGADSAVCGWAAVRSSGNVRAVHVEHGLPGSPAMAEAATKVAEALGVPLEIKATTVPAGASPEGQARLARHQALEGAVGSRETILTGHTADDLAETVLSNLLRGAGAAGLAGIPRRRPTSDGESEWVRPLLDVWRSETREAATLLGLPWRDDPANREPGFRRNVLRSDVIPDLEERFNPGLKAVLVTTARVLDADDEALDAGARRVPMVTEGTAVRVPATLVTTLANPVASRVVRRALRRARGPHAGTAAEVAVALEVVEGRQRRATLGDDLIVEREGPWLTLHRGPEVDPVPVAVVVPGEAGFNEWRVRTWLERRPPTTWPLGRSSAVMDADALMGDSVLRAPEPGDRIAIGAGTKTVADVLAEAGVPPRLRPSWPIMETDGRPVWVVGVRTAAWSWVSPATTRYLWLEATRE